jgi:methylmalonyl-CoA mutase N-terminal domain/subunit
VAEARERTFVVGQDFFHEIARFRAARRLWPAEVFHARTPGGSDPEDLIRNTLRVLSAVLGGADYVDGESAERIRRVIEFESGITLVSDAFGGSYYLEKLTDEMEISLRNQA